MMWEDSMFVNKETGTPIESTNELFADAVANPDNYERLPTVGEVEIDLGTTANGMVADALKALEENAIKKEKGEKVEGECLSDKHVSLYEKFVT